MNGPFRSGLTLASVMLLFCGCGTYPSPSPKIYNIGDETKPKLGLTGEAGLQHLELTTVTVPNHLDTTDIVRRSARDQLITGRTGRWGERLSIGITRALAVDLATRLPNMVIESRDAHEAARRLRVDIKRFEIGADGRCTLTARWRMSTRYNKLPVNSEQGTFVILAMSTTDAAESLAMTSAIDQLADRLAVTVGAQAH